MLRHDQVVAIVATAVFTSACSTPTYDEAWLSEQWTQALATYNIRAIYPPTEDVHVGDVYGFATNEVDKNGVPITGALWSAVKMAYIPLNKELENYYSQIPIFPATTTSPGTGMWTQPTTGTSPAKVVSNAPDPAQKPAGKKQKKVVNQTPPSPVVATSESVFAKAGIWTRLPLVAFPGFTIGHADVENASASLPLRFFHSIFGYSRTHQDNVSITIRAAETYGVPALDAKLALLKFCQEQQSTGTCSKYALNVELATLSGKAPPDVAIALVNRLYLTRSIEYTYKSSTSNVAGGSMYITLQKVLDNQQTLIKALGSQTADNSTTQKNQKSAGTKAGAASPASAASAASAAAAAGAPATNGSTSNGGSDAQGTDSTVTAENINALKNSLDDLISAMQASNQQLIAGPVPGASISVGSITENSITLIQTFERPIAIGYRYVGIEGTLPATSSK